MFSRVRIAIRFFFLGLAAGVLLAPRSGEETRRMLRERADRLLNDILDAASLGAGSADAGAPPAEEAAAPKSSRGANGSGSGSRSRRSSTTTSDTEAEAEATAGA